MKTESVNNPAAQPAIMNNTETQSAAVEATHQPPPHWSPIPDWLTVPLFVCPKGMQLPEEILVGYHAYEAAGYALLAAKRNRLPKCLYADAFHSKVTFRKTLQPSIETVATSLAGFEAPARLLPDGDNWGTFTPANQVTQQPLASSLPSLLLDLQKMSHSRSDDELQQIVNEARAIVEKAFNDPAFTLAIHDLAQLLIVEALHAELNWLFLEEDSDHPALRGIVVSKVLENAKLCRSPQLNQNDREVAETIRKHLLRSAIPHERIETYLVGVGAIA